MRRWFPSTLQQLHHRRRLLPGQVSRKYDHVRHESDVHLHGARGRHCQQPAGGGRPCGVTSAAFALVNITTAITQLVFLLALLLQSRYCEML